MEREWLIISGVATVIACCVAVLLIRAKRSQVTARNADRIRERLARTRREERNSLLRHRRVLRDSPAGAPFDDVYDWLRDSPINDDFAGNRWYTPFDD